ncbi:uncharacterized protein CLUP02_17364 [Colletotrichum lupini]|uniref:Uncharacterized protein n=1 Tax=Colletotrichum lupini TaxID=145971 RepID=A0A9Q8SEP7_9PEZI|nr:uncharacterized protein CLUP02_17364 [Colletotrichum lupini]UQC75855.1 hypothetical protein CLUP02_17364 [Colletotrichum lupini]
MSARLTTPETPAGTASSDPETGTPTRPGRVQVDDNASAPPSLRHVNPPCKRITHGMMKSSTALYL